MIRQVIIRSKKWMKAFLKGNYEDGLYADGFVDFSPPWAIISINDPGDHKMHHVIKNYFERTGDESTPFRIYWFEDADFDPKEDYPGGYLFTRSNANSIIDFVEKLIAAPQQYLLLVHCWAGISRSGAVGMFASSLAGCDKHNFACLNPQIQPNASIHSKLMRVWNEQQNHYFDMG